MLTKKYAMKIKRNKEFHTRLSEGSERRIPPLKEEKENLLSR